jgi:hypothetical protein
MRHFEQADRKFYRDLGSVGGEFEAAGVPSGRWDEALSPGREGEFALCRQGFDINGHVGGREKKGTGGEGRRAGECGLPSIEEVGLELATGRGEWRSGRWESEVVKDPVGDGRVLDESDDSTGAAAGGAKQNVDGEYPFQERGPVEIVGVDWVHVRGQTRDERGARAGSRVGCGVFRSERRRVGFRDDEGSVVGVAREDVPR